MKKMIAVVLIFICSTIMSWPIYGEVYDPDGDNGQETMEEEAISNFAITLYTSGIDYFDEVIEVYCTKDGQFYGDFDLSPINDYTYRQLLLPGRYVMKCRVRYDRYQLYCLDRTELYFEIDEANIREHMQQVVNVTQNPNFINTGNKDANEEDLESAFYDIEKWDREHSFLALYQPQTEIEDVSLGEVTINPEPTRLATEKEEKHSQRIYFFLVMAGLLLGMAVYLMHLAALGKERKWHNE
ncbi:MAG: hypothetical protein KH230_09735 [Enterocloster asparagiformis]|nr:hypothetical protein [Enterocloster asparagiformis]